MSLFAKTGTFWPGLSGYNFSRRMKTAELTKTPAEIIFPVDLPGFLFFKQ